MELRRTTMRGMRRAHRALVLTAAHRRGPISRAELAEHTALSPASVSTLVAELLAEGLVEEAGTVDSDGGRPRILLRVRPGAGRVAGAEVGETGVRVQLYDLALSPLATHEQPGSAAGIDPATLADRVRAGLTAVLAEADRAGPTGPLLGLGVAVPGLVNDPTDGVVHAPTVGWDGVPLGALLRAGTGTTVLVENGAGALGRAECWAGAGREAIRPVVALLGSGVGAALPAGDRPGTGPPMFGEWGHTTLVFDGRACRCGHRGCLEAYIGADAVLARWAESSRSDRDPQRTVPAETAHHPSVGYSDDLPHRLTLPTGTDTETAFAALLSAARDEPRAVQVVAETIEYLGAGLADLVNLLGPDRIVLGGWAGSALAAEHLPAVRAAAQRRALSRAFTDVQVVAGELGRDGVAFGAALLPLQRVLDSGGLPAPAG